MSTRRLRQLPIVEEVRSSSSARMLDLMNSISRAQQVARVEQVARAEASTPADVGSGIAQQLIDLSSSVPVPLKGGHAIYYRRVKSNPAGRLIIDLGGRIEYLIPGSRITGHFRKATIIRDADSATSGHALIAVMQRPDVNLEDPVDASAGIAVATWSEQQAGTRADPTLSTEGMSLSGIRGVLVGIMAEAGNTITAGSLAFWRYDDALGVWGLMHTVALPTGERVVWLNEEVIATPSGRILAATVGVTVSGGANPTVLARGAA